MRLVALGAAALALALTAQAPLAAQTHVPTPPLATGEVLVEVSALGIVTAHADRATLSFSIRGTGDTTAAARTDAAQKVREVTALLRAQGVAEADIRIEPVTAYPGGAADAAMAEAQAAMNAAAAAAQRAAAEVAGTNASEPAPEPEPTIFSAAAPTEVVVRNVASVTAILAALTDRHIELLQGANYALDDDSVPRRQARMQAMQKARADAETYAAALNMRIVRVARVTERLGMDVMSLAATERMGSSFLPFNMGRGNGAELPIVAAVGVDFVLAPR